jgi:AbrB family looped-hinge helix DNA binding protein
MRITSKGQVTIPAAIREKAGLLPNTDVEFALNPEGQVLLFRTKAKGSKKSRGELLVEHLRAHARKHPIKMTTDEIMKLTRGD